jgi:hypothetical protein
MTPLTPYLVYIKVGAVVTLLAVVAGAGYHFGGMASKTKLEGFQQAQSANTAKAVLAERASAAVELARVNAILKEYQDAPIDPATVSLGSRVLEYARVAECPVSSASPHPAGIVSTAAQSSGLGPIEQATQAVFDACAADAKELAALQSVWPR